MPTRAALSAVPVTEVPEAPAAVTDTCALVWYATGQTRKLGRYALRQFERADRGEATVVVPALVLVEIAELVQRGHLTLSMPFGQWVDALLSNPCYILQSLSGEIVIRAHDLQAIPERSDRLIAATAVWLDCALMTRDAAIAATAVVPVLWG